MKRAIFLILFVMAGCAMAGCGDEPSPQELVEEGRKYYWGADGVPQDFKKAFELYQKAADQGYAEAQYQLGVMYWDGRGGTPQDDNKSLEFIQKAADQGHSYAQFRLGRLYRDGLGLPQDYGKAFEWYQKAADQGNEDALFDLGLLYYEGQGIPQNDVMAYAYMLVMRANASREYGPSISVEEDNLRERLTPEQQAQAKEEAERIRAKYEK